MCVVVPRMLDATFYLSVGTCGVHQLGSGVGWSYRTKVAYDICSFFFFTRQCNKTKREQQRQLAYMTGVNFPRSW